MKQKISIIGAGNVGSSIAFSLIEMDLDTVLVDIDKDKTDAMALDISQASTLVNFKNIKLSSDYTDISDSDIVVVTAGLPRRPGMSRDDLLLKNASIVQSVSKEIKKYAPNTIVIIVSNPLDAMVYTALKATGFDSSRVFGMAGVLDSARMNYFIRQELPNTKEVQSIVLGGHGDSMVPIISQCKADDKPISELLSDDIIEKIITKTQNGGKQIVELLKTGSAYYAPAQSVSIMIKSILLNEGQTLPVSIYLKEHDSASGMLVELGKNGIHKIIDLELNEKEKKLFLRSIANVTELIDVLKRDFFEKS